MSDKATEQDNERHGAAEAPTAQGVRARVRAELTSAIKASARSQLATEGASSLSLRAVARDLGMASSAVYRYFASRDALLTALIVDAYNAVGDAVEAASTTSPPGASAQLSALATAFRAWAVSNPHEYALIYGSPVPGYEAPEDTIDPAVRAPLVLTRLIIDAWHAGHVRPELAESPATVDGALQQFVEFTGDAVPASVLAHAVGMWAEMVGLVTLELFGHFNNTVTDPETLFAWAIEQMGNRVFVNQPAG